MPKPPSADRPPEKPTAAGMQIGETLPFLCTALTEDTQGNLFLPADARPLDPQADADVIRSSPQCVLIRRDADGHMLILRPRNQGHLPAPFPSLPGTTTLSIRSHIRTTGARIDNPVKALREILATSPDLDPEKRSHIEAVIAWLDQPGAQAKLAAEALAAAPSKTKSSSGLTRAGDLVPEILKPEMKPLTPIQERLVSMPTETGGEESIVYQHSVLCQTCLPYRDPGDEIRAWERTNGFISLRIQAGTAYDAAQSTWVDVGLPHGPKPRLVLYHLNAEALRTQSPAIELGDSLTAFVKRTLDLDPHGRNIRTVRDQLSRLAAADFRFGTGRDGHSVTIKGNVIDGFELWTPKSEKQRVLWPTTVQFSPIYFQSLMQHAVPLNEEAVGRLSHSAMGLDIYTWLAQRLHRVDPRKPALVPWVSLKEQFGHGYAHMFNFKRVFRTTLKQVAAVYKDAKFSMDEKGMHLQNSRPPVARRIVQIK